MALSKFRKRKLPNDSRTVINSNMTRGNETTKNSNNEQSLALLGQPDHRHQDKEEYKGIPAEVLTPMLHVLQLYTQYYGDPLSYNEEIQQQQSESTRGSGNSGSSLLSRIQAAEKAANNEADASSSSSSSAVHPRRAERQKRQEALGVFLDTVRYHQPNGPVACLSYLWNNGTCGVVGGGGMQQPKQPRQHVDQSKQHAALHLATELLKKSKDCRAYLTTGKRLQTFVDYVATGRNSKQNDIMVTASLSSASSPSLVNGGRSGDHRKIRWRRFQQSAFALLESLASNFGSLYPRLIVAHMSLQQRLGVQQSNVKTHDATDRDGGGDAVIGSFVSDGDMVQLRKVRDLSLKYGENEYDRVVRMVELAQKCFDVLVPRFGHEDETDANIKNHTLSTSTSVESSLPMKDSNENNDDDGDDDGDDDDDDDFGDIDWEEGEEETAAIDTIEDSHEASVERTLAVMKHSGGLQQGSIQVDFAAPRPPPFSVSSPLLETTAAVVNNDPNNWKETAKIKLQKCIHLFETRHLPRLKVWVEALTRADGLAPSQQTSSEIVASISSSSLPLVLLPAHVREKRRPILEKLMQAKSAVATVMAKAAQIGIGSTAATRARDPLLGQTRAEEGESSSARQHYDGNSFHSRYVAPANATENNQQGRIRNRLFVQPHRKPQKLKARVQIKYRKTH